MAKKVHGRTPAKSKTRARRAPASSPVRSASPAVGQDEFPTGQAVQTPPAPAPTFASTRNPGVAAATSRRTPPARRAPVLTFNYDYLRGDVQKLSIFAPSMVVLLIIAFFIFR